MTLFLRQLSRRAHHFATALRPLALCNQHPSFSRFNVAAGPGLSWQPSLRSVVYRPPRYYQQQRQLQQLRYFHASRPQNVPIVPLPAALLSAVKTGKFVSLVSLSSRTSLTLLPHAFFKNGKRRLLLASIPFLGIIMLVLVGLDQANNTSRLRLIYLTEEEEKELVQETAKQLLAAQAGLVVPREDSMVKSLQQIVDNLARVAADDVREPVRKYEEDSEKVPKFVVDLIWDNSTLNAFCIGEQIIVYDLMLKAMGADADKMAAILAHEIAHKLQRHTVEQHGFASLLVMLGDIFRGVFWGLTDSFGPFANEKINEAITSLITLETETKYNRKLEREADLIGLKLMAKAGYDPEVAIEVWQTMAAIEDAAKTEVPADTDKPETLTSIVESWFGSSHPPSLERVEYIKEHMKEAVAIYEESLRINGPPKAYVEPAKDDKPESVVEPEQLSWWITVKSWFWPATAAAA